MVNQHKTLNAIFLPLQQQQKILATPIPLPLLFLSL